MQEETGNNTPSEEISENRPEVDKTIPPPVDDDPLKDIPEKAIVALTNSIRSRLEIDYEKKFQVWKTKEFATFAEKQDEALTKAVQDYIKDLEEKRRPPTDEEIEKLLNQEYKEFSLKVKPVNNGDEEKEFIIRELPMDAEQQFFRQFRDNVKNKSSDIAALAQRIIDTPKEEQVMALLNAVDGMFDVIADATAISLNPLKENQGINRKWVKENISSMRQWNICQAQVRVNRLRDFFYQLYLAGKQATSMTTGPNVQV